MRLWTLHPKYLDSRGLVALWREGLLAQAVLRGKTNGYVHHPQLIRFRGRPSPVGAIAEYLRIVLVESLERGFRFSAARISRKRGQDWIAVRRGQLEYEWKHLMAKLQARDPAWRSRLESVKRPQAHPIFRVVRGEIETWEKIA